MGLMGVEVLLGSRESIVEILNDFVYCVLKLTPFGIHVAGQLSTSGSHSFSRIYIILCVVSIIRLIRIFIDDYMNVCS